MNKFFRIFLSALLINTIFMSTVFADPISEQLQKQQNKLEQDKNSLKTVQNENQKLEINIENLDNQIGAQMSKATETKNLISKKQLDIKNSEMQIQKIDTDILKDQNLFNSRVRVMYMNGNISYISILLSSKGFNDAISRIDIMKKIIEFDKKIIKDLNDKKIVSNNKKEILSNENKKLLALNSQNQANLAQLQQSIASQKNMIVTLKSKEFALASNVDASQVAINSTLKQIDEIRKAAPKTSVSRGISISSSGASAISSNNVIAYASNFLGTPYLWGGTRPYVQGDPTSGFDCSGFTQYVYAHFGIRIGRTTYDQINDGVGVARSNLQPGDLVFFGANSPHHMGIYVGNGNYIHAPHTGDVIKISPVGRSDYMTARRVK